MVVAALMLACWSCLGTDYNLSLSKLSLINIDDLLEVLDKWVALMEVSLNFDQHLLQYLLLSLTHSSWKGHT